MFISNTPINYKFKLSILKSITDTIQLINLFIKNEPKKVNRKRTT